MGAFNAGLFFEAVRSSRGLGHNGTLTQAQVDGFNTVIAACAADSFTAPEAAYALATAWWETARTMQPIAEMGGNSYFTRMYDPLGSRPDLARRNGNTTPGDGIKYRGRGYVQLTWKTNYEKAGRKIGVDLVNNPDRAMEPAIAARILTDGMAEGWFTGKRLRDYIKPGSPPNFVGARRIINGTDKDAEIAAIARIFLQALERGEYSRAPVKPAPLPPAMPPDVEPIEPRPVGFWARFFSSLMRRLKG